MCDDAERMNLEWGKAYISKPTDHIKLDNPYAGKYLFKPSYVKEPVPDIHHLLSWEYGRTWKREHHQYVMRRINKTKPKHFKPDVYARRRMLQPKEPIESKPLTRSKLYEKSQKKIDNRK